MADPKFSVNVTASYVGNGTPGEVSPFQPETRNVGNEDGKSFQDQAHGFRVGAGGSLLTQGGFYAAFRLFYGLGGYGLENVTDSDKPLDQWGVGGLYHEFGAGLNLGGGNNTVVGYGLLEYSRRWLPTDGSSYHEDPANIKVPTPAETPDGTDGTEAAEPEDMPGQNGDPDSPSFEDDGTPENDAAPGFNGAETKTNEDGTIEVVDTGERDIAVAGQPAEVRLHSLTRQALMFGGGVKVQATDWLGIYGQLGVGPAWYEARVTTDSAPDASLTYNTNALALQGEVGVEFAAYTVNLDKTPKTPQRPQVDAEQVKLQAFITSELAPGSQLRKALGIPDDAALEAKRVEWAPVFDANDPKKITGFTRNALVIVQKVPTADGKGTEEAILYFRRTAPTATAATPTVDLVPMDQTNFETLQRQIKETKSREFAREFSLQRFEFETGIPRDTAMPALREKVTAATSDGKTADLAALQGIFGGVFQGDSLQRLHTTATKLATDADLKDFAFFLDGHASRLGSVGLNDELSKNRAEVISLVFKAVGVDPKRFEGRITGFGFDQPLAGVNATDKSNQRVELIPMGEDGNRAPAITTSATTGTTTDTSQSTKWEDRATYVTVAPDAKARTVTVTTFGYDVTDTTPYTANWATRKDSVTISASGDMVKEIFAPKQGDGDAEPVEGSLYEKLAGAIAHNKPVEIDLDDLLAAIAEEQTTAERAVWELESTITDTELAAIEAKIAGHHTFTDADMSKWMPLYKKFVEATLMVGLAGPGVIPKLGSILQAIGQDKIKGLDNNEKAEITAKIETTLAYLKTNAGLNTKIGKLAIVITATLKAKEEAAAAAAVKFDIPTKEITVAQGVGQAEWTFTGPAPADGFKLVTMGGAEKGIAVDGNKIIRKFSQAYTGTVTYKLLGRTSNTELAILKLTVQAGTSTSP